MCERLQKAASVHLRYFVMDSGTIHVTLENYYTLKTWFCLSSKVPR